MSPFQIAFARVLLGALVLVPICVAGRKHFPRTLGTWGHLAVAALFANTIPFTLFPLGEEHVSSVVASIWNGTTPLFTILIGLVALRAEFIDHRKLTGIAVGFLGLLVVVGPWRGIGEASLYGQFICIVAAASYAVSLAYTRRFLMGSAYSPLVLAAGQLVCATAQLGLSTVLFARTEVSWSPGVVGSALALGLLGTGFAYVIYFGVITEVGAVTTSTVTYLAPIVATVLGVAVLHEDIHWNLFVGAVFVVLGALYAEGRLHGQQARG